MTKYPKAFENYFKKTNHQDLTYLTEKRMLFNAWKAGRRYEKRIFISRTFLGVRHYTKYPSLEAEDIPW